MAKLRAKAKFYKGQGTNPIPAPGADTFDVVSNAVNISGPETTKDEIEHTDMDSTAKEFFGDLANQGSITVSGNRNFGNAGQTACRTNAGNSSQFNFRVEWIDPSDDSVVETADFQGEVMEWSVEAASGSPEVFNLRVKITGSVTYS